MKFRKMSLALVTVLALGIGSVGIANASTTMLHQPKNLVHMKSLLTTPGKDMHAPTVSITKSPVNNSSDKVTITSAADSKTIQGLSAVNTQIKDHYKIHQLMINSMPKNISTNHYVYMKQNMANMGRFMTKANASSMVQHMSQAPINSAQSTQQPISNMIQNMNSGMGQQMGSGMM